MISGRAKLAGVMGWPVGHSRSPRLHGTWLRQYGIDGAYVPLAVEPSRLEQALRALPALGFRGVNLTIPHKEAALGIVDRIEPLAARIGAVNTVIVGEDGKLDGRNTDAFGFQENLRAAGFALEEKGAPAAVLGAGGAARAVIAALQDMGFSEIRLVNRTRDRAGQCAGSLRAPGLGAINVVAWEEAARALEDAALLVNTTSLGMNGQPPLDMDLAPLPSGAWVTDIVYTPLETALLRRARQRNLRVVDGLGMLLHQARPGFAAWFGVEPEVTGDLREAVLADD
ncbi:MAG: shikimate dehydrogenase [Alphaproteobacteria bacterium]|nr:shikimate dehydrogenase [Alphaproteobacteria bacterium]